MTGLALESPIMNRAPSQLPSFVAATILFLAANLGSPAHAQVTTFNDQAAFQAALSGAFTLVNLDDQPLSGFAAPYTVEAPGPAAAFSSLGIDFQVFDAAVIDGQAFQISVPGRDRLIINGVGSSTGGDLAIDLVDPVAGFGARSNINDGGRVRVFSGPGLSGTFLGEAAIGSGGFGGLISTQPIRSIEVTCDFDFDLICGVYDLQHGTQAAPVPIDPRVGVVLLFGLAGVGLVMVRRSGRLPIANARRRAGHAAR